MKKTYLLAVAALALSFSACSEEHDEQIQAAKENYAAVVYANYQDALEGATELNAKIEVFLATPTQANFDAIKTTWLAVRPTYGQTEGFRFYGGPIDDEDGPEGLINAWPLDEVYIDNIISDAVAHPDLTGSVLAGLNEDGGEANISTGWHAIEYLLWGADLNPAGPGNRSYTDYTTGPDAMRRGEYLAAAGDLLVANLQEVTDEWAPGQDNYRKTFVGMDDETALSYMLQGIGFLAKGELAGERLSVAYDSQLQEDEHSCFSDNTHMDIRANMKSIANVYRGTYLQVSGSTVTGTSLSDLVAAKDATLAADIETLLDECTTACENIQAPFDQEILASNPAGRERVNEAITKLRQLGDKLSEAAGVLGVSITIE